MTLLSKNWLNSIVEGICLNLKWFLQVWYSEHWCRENEMLQLNKLLMLGFIPEELFFRSTLGDLTQRPSDMRATQHEPMVEISKSQKVV